MDRTVVVETCGHIQVYRTQSASNGPGAPVTKENPRKRKNVYTDAPRVATLGEILAETQLWRCPAEGCTYTCSRTQTLLFHAKMHSPEITEQIKKMQSHVAKGQVMCPFCEYVFVDIYGLRRHYFRKHCESKDHICPNPVCAKKFALEHDLIQHKNHCIDNIYHCICGKDFANRTALKRHVDKGKTCQPGTHEMDIRPKPRDEIVIPEISEPEPGHLENGGEQSGDIDEGMEGNAALVDVHQHPSETDDQTYRVDSENSDGSLYQPTVQMLQTMPDQHSGETQVGDEQTYRVASEPSDGSLYQPAVPLLQTMPDHNQGLGSVQDDPSPAYSLQPAI